MAEPEDSVPEEPTAPTDADSTPEPHRHHQDGFSMPGILNDTTDSEAPQSDPDSFASPTRSSVYNIQPDTEMAPSTDAASDDIRCVCDNTDDDGFTIQCDDCLVWQHAICVGISKDNVPDSYYCDVCRPDLHQKVCQYV
jgi:hypothetical protein